MHLLRCTLNAKMLIIFKKGNKKDLKNYKRICLLSNGYKVLTKELTKRVKQALDGSKLDSEEDTQRQTTSTS